MESQAAELPAIATPVLRLPTGRAARSLLFAALAIQVIHVGVHLFAPHPAFPADVMEFLAATMSAGICYYKMRHDRQSRHLWLELGIAFSIWAVAELQFAFAARHPGVTESAFSDLLWLIYAFPLLLVTSYTPQSSRRDPAGWLDAAQAFVFFCILFALFFPAPGIISQAISDVVQGVALLLVLILRYCIAEPGRDRAFFRNLTTYMVVYLVFCILYYLTTNHGFAVGSFVELCWSIPFTFFSVIALCTDLSGKEEAESLWAARAARAGYIQGATALGLAVMSLAGAAVLAYHRPVPGAVALGVAFLLFAARTSAREWQLQSVHSQLKRSVLRDPLTSVANRTLLDAEITQRLARLSTAQSGSTAVLFVGLDRFKTLNDCLGHIFGDLLLQRVADLLTASVRKQDLVARYGGDEFVILLSGVDVKEAEAFAERILGQLRSPLHLEGRLLYLTASIGFAMSRPGATAPAMLQEAHFAMHHAKRSGKDRAQVFEPEMLRVPQFRLGIETDLRKALEEDQISVHYQPIFSVQTGEIEGFEALARWHHPERGQVSPADFIPVAEDTGMIIDLGNQILLKACKQCREWNQRFGAAWTMNVNVSAHQFASPKILEQIVHTLFQTGLEARYLKLEITESVLISGYSHVEEVLAEARKLGMQICLDDFGTGYSSLSYLLNYPFDVVKIDQSFVRHLDEDPSRADVVRTLISLARSLNKHMVAEGIERSEEMDCLREFGCELAQGYLLSRPLSAEAATTLLQAQNKIVTIRSSSSPEDRYLGSEISAAS
jgi:diguanylate cyclase (GGDEF)-like protein